MTELQKVEFEMLKLFINICNELNLRYYLVCGSALGAVKYEGFIPWDDDIDVALPRKDYEKFCENAPRMFPNYYFLQNYKTDSYFPLIGSKIRDVRTTFIEKGHSDLNIVHGVYIDIFPLDEWSGDIEIIKQLDRKKAFYERRRTLILNQNRHIWNIRSYWLHFFYEKFNYRSDISKTLEEYTEFLKDSSVNNGYYYCNHHEEFGIKEYTPKEWYGDGIKKVFEGMSVTIPQKYDEYFSKRYGNWRMELPKQEQVGHHYYEILDLDCPYTNYIDEVSKNGKKIKLKMVK